MSEKVKVVLFSGGRGTLSITKVLIDHPQIELSILVNGYDDGLSTGRIRDQVKGMLGPSDFRKNISYLLDTTQDHKKALKAFLEYRFSKEELNVTLVDSLRKLSLMQKTNIVEVDNIVLSMNVQDYLWSVEMLKLFLTNSQNIDNFDFRDCSIGNILMAGCFINSSFDFNSMLENICSALGVKTKLLNISMGENVVLSAIKNEGEFLKDESSIVSEGSSPIAEIFLLENYLSVDETDELNNIKFLNEKMEYLRNRTLIPKLNPAARSSIAEADVIIYGPGTQHSSLFPSYLTEGCVEAISNNKQAFKVFIGNINADFDIVGESAKNLFSKFMFYMNRKNQVEYKLEDYLTHLFLQSNFIGGTDLGVNVAEYGITLKILDWEKNKGQHSMSVISDELLALAQAKKANKVEDKHHLISIVVPVLNEIKTVTKVLGELEKLNLFDMNLEKEIIVVDGGSTDGSLEAIKTHKEIKIISAPRKIERGEAYQLGIKESKGNIIVFFPSDGEYLVNDIKKILLPFLTEQAKCVLGTRATKSIKTSETILEIYRGNKFLFFMSKYGGILLSILMLIFHNRYITDTLTTVKAIHRRTISDWVYRSKGVDFDMELLIKLIQNDQYIYEVPVTYTPRTKSAGKKISLRDGIFSIFTILRG